MATAPGSVENSAEFRASIPETNWGAPPPGQLTPIKLALEITNVGDHALVFALLDTVTLEISLDGVEWRRMDGGRNGTRPSPAISAPVEPGGTLLIERDARLGARPPGFRLIGGDEFGSVWYLDAVPIGEAWLRFSYVAPTPGESRGARFWTGDARTPPIRVHVREQEGDEP